MFKCCKPDAREAELRADSVVNLKHRHLPQSSRFFRFIPSINYYVLDLPDKKIFGV